MTVLISQWAPAGLWSPCWWWWRLSPGPWCLSDNTQCSHSLHNNQHQAEADTRPRVLKAHSSDINLDNVNMLLRSAFFTSLWFLWTALIVSPGQARFVLTGSAISNPPVLVMTRHPRPLVILTSSIVRLSSVSPVSHSTPRSPATAITKTRGSPTINWR